MMRKELIWSGLIYKIIGVQHNLSDLRVYTYSIPSTTGIIYEVPVVRYRYVLVPVPVRRHIAPKGLPPRPY